MTLMNEKFALVILGVVLRNPKQLLKVRFALMPENIALV